MVHPQCSSACCEKNKGDAGQIEQRTYVRTTPVPFGYVRTGGYSAVEKHTTSAGAHPSSHTRATTAVRAGRVAISGTGLRFVRGTASTVAAFAIAIAIPLALALALAISLALALALALTIAVAVAVLLTIAVAAARATASRMSVTSST